MFTNPHILLDVRVYAFNHSTQESEAGRLHQVQGLPTVSPYFLPTKGKFQSCQRDHIFLGIKVLSKKTVIKFPLLG